MDDGSEHLKAITEELGLDHDDYQDWGIVNGKADRFVEFVAYFEQLDKASNLVRMEFFQLVISSYNELLLEQSESDIKATVFNSFISKHGRDELFKPIVRYWAGIANDDEFPVGYFLLMRKPSLLADTDGEDNREDRFFNSSRILYGLGIAVLTVYVFFKDLLSEIVLQNWGLVAGGFLILIFGHGLVNRKK